MKIRICSRCYYGLCGDHSPYIINTQWKDFKCPFPTHDFVVRTHEEELKEDKINDLK